MASINRLKPGQIVYSVERVKMGNVKMSYGALYKVEIVEVHEDHVIASWNGNSPRKFGEASIKKWKVKQPKPKYRVLGIDSY